MQYMVYGVFLISEHEFVISFALTRIGLQHMAEEIAENRRNILGACNFPN